MEIWLKQDNAAIQIPILPPSFQVTLETAHQTVNVQTKGDVTILGKRGLRTIEFTSFFPAQRYPFALPTIIKPYTYTHTISRMWSKPIRITITGTNINMLTTMQSFVYGEPDSTGDVEYTLSLQEYRPPTYTKPKSKPKMVSLGEIKVNLNEKSKVRAELELVNNSKQKTYTVKKGDNLWDLAKKYYGSGSKMPKLYKANKSVIEKAAKQHGYTSSSNKGIAGWWIFPGTKLVIPK